MTAKQIEAAWKKLTAELTTYEVELTIELTSPDGTTHYRKETGTRVCTAKGDSLTDEVANEIREQVTGTDPDLESTKEDGTLTTWTSEALWIEDGPTWRITAKATKANN